MTKKYRWPKGSLIARIKYDPEAKEIYPYYKKRKNKKGKQIPFPVKPELKKKH